MFKNYSVREFVVKDNTSNYLPIVKITIQSWIIEERFHNLDNPLIRGY